MKINPLKEYNNQNNKPNFKAKLQISGNTNLLTSSQIDTLKEFGSRIGSKADIIDISLPISNRFTKNKANVNIAEYVDGKLKQFTLGIEKNNVLGSLIAGLKSNYVVKEVNFDAWKEVFDLKDEETFKALDRLRRFANSNSDGAKFSFNSVEDMLERINAPINKWGDNIILYAVKNADYLKLCLKHPNINVNSQGPRNETALHMASRYPYPESLKLLLERNDIDMTIEDTSGKTAEQIAWRDAAKIWDEYAKNGYKKFW